MKGEDLHDKQENRSSEKSILPTDYCEFVAMQAYGILPEGQSTRISNLQFSTENYGKIISSRRCPPMRLHNCAEAVQELRPFIRSEDRFFRDRTVSLPMHASLSWQQPFETKERRRTRVRLGTPSRGSYGNGASSVLAQATPSASSCVKWGVSTRQESRLRGDLVCHQFFHIHITSKSVKLHPARKSKN